MDGIRTTSNTLTQVIEDGRQQEGRGRTTGTRTKDNAGGRVK